jgi:hypothetical protein
MVEEIMATPQSKPYVVRVLTSVGEIVLHLSAYDIVEAMHQASIAVSNDELTAVKFVSVAPDEEALKERMKEEMSLYSNALIGAKNLAKELREQLKEGNKRKDGK